VAVLASAPGLFLLSVSASVLPGFGDRIDCRTDKSAVLLVRAEKDEQILYPGRDEDICYPDLAFYATDG
jgi:hypothetical protein